MRASCRDEHDRAVVCVRAHRVLANASRTIPTSRSIVHGGACSLFVPALAGGALLCPAAPSAQAPAPGRVVLVSLDGTADWVVDWLIEKGKAPALAQMAQGWRRRRGGALHRPVAHRRRPRRPSGRALRRRSPASAATRCCWRRRGNTPSPRPRAASSRPRAVPSRSGTPPSAPASARSCCRRPARTRSRTRHPSMSCCSTSTARATRRRSWSPGRSSTAATRSTRRPARRR